MSRLLSTYALRFAAQTRRVISSDRFFYATVLLFVIEAGWIALTAVYPQAFDEQYHLGIIKIYAAQWSPFLAHQPAGADVLGAVARDPSYMYHYLLSFPYRLITHFTSNLPTVVICLRFISVALLAGALFIYRRLLRSVPLSKTLVHLVLLFFVLIPVVPLLGAQINYDNALIGLVGLSLLWTLQLLRILQTNQRLPLALTLKLLAVCLFASLVKYAFLPFFIAIVVLCGIQMIRSHVFEPVRLQASWRMLQRGQLIILGAVTALLLGLFVAMYGVNTLRYHTPVPDCSAVIGTQACLKYPPWARNYQLSHTFPRPPAWKIAIYPATWVNVSIRELTFAITSRFEEDGVTVDYYTAEPLPVMRVAAWAAASVGTALVVVYARRLWHDVALRTLLVTSLAYALVLFLQNLSDFLETGQAVAIHGRYLLPILPLLLAIIGRCAVWAIQDQRRTVRQTLYASQLWLVVLSVVILAQGSGFITYILRSDPDWMWPQDSSIYEVNHAAKKVLHPVVVGSKPAE
jgi:hypothetical protein